MIIPCPFCKEENVVGWRHCHRDRPGYSVYRQRKVNTQKLCKDVVIKTFFYTREPHGMGENIQSFVHKTLNRKTMMETFSFIVYGSMAHRGINIYFRHTLRIYIYWNELPEEAKKREANYHT